MSPYGDGLDGRGPIPGMGNRFFFSPPEEGAFPGIRRPKGEVDSPASGVEVKNSGAIPPLPHMALHSA
jgi:hypothetical protein